MLEAAQVLFFKLLMDPEPPSQEVAASFLALAQSIICGYLGLQALPEGQNIPHVLAMLAIVLYNRRGAEGEIKRIEGDLVSWFETMPELIKLQLRPYRKAIAHTWPQGAT